MDFQAIMQAKGETLEITKIQLDQGEASCGGYISIPFVWKNLGTDAPVLPPSGKVMATFQSENIDIKKLFEDVGVKPPASGTVNVKLDAQGTLADLNARLDVQMRNLRSEKLEKLEPASFDFTVPTQHDRLALFWATAAGQDSTTGVNGKFAVRRPENCSPRKIAGRHAVDRKIRLPRSSVNFVRQIGAAKFSNSMAMWRWMSMSSNGVAKPFFTGTADMTINVARSGNTTFPALKRL